MQKRKTFTVMVILLAILVLGVGYATVSQVTLTLNGTANIKANADFTVVYDTSHTPTYSTLVTPTEASVAGAYTSTSVATMTFTLDAKNPEVYAIYKIDNNSSELAASLAAAVTQVSGDNAAYFDTITAAYYTDAACTTALSGNLAHGASAYLKVTVGLAKSPVTDKTGATFTVVTTATPQEA